MRSKFPPNTDVGCTEFPVIKTELECSEAYVERDVSTNALVPESLLDHRRDSHGYFYNRPFFRRRQIFQQVLQFVCCRFVQLIRVHLNLPFCSYLKYNRAKLYVACITTGAAIVPDRSLNRPYEKPFT